MLAMMGSAPMRALNVRTNLIPRINYGAGRHLSRAGRKAFLGGMADLRVAGGHHCPMNDDPAQFADALRAFAAR
jgi:pimeloyl-ACP methyl ester carboxylesterase